MNCLNCDKPVELKKWKKKFCNKSCACTYNNKIKPKRKRVSRLYNCTYCGNPISHAGKIYCSMKCSSLARKIKDLSLTTQDSTRKRIILEETGYICSICKITSWMEDKVPLVLDHINGNSEDNSRENLRLVCGNCNMQLPTFVARNRGNGRHYRRQRYKEGLSY